MKVVVTGANGFVGSRFMQYSQAKFHLRPISLRSNDLTATVLWGTDTILHLAGKAHDMQAKNEQEYFDVNFELTKKLALKAKAEGVNHFIYISSVKVYGQEDRTTLDEQSACYPEDAYGKSKLDAELFLRSIETNQFKVAIVRPPLVYGPGVKGNMIKILKLADSNLPLPFGRTNNHRSMVFLDNLVELINKIIETRSSGTFVAGDAKTVSTDELITALRKVLHRKPRLISIPAIGRQLLRKLKPSFFNRLFGSFVINNSKTNQVLKFEPPYAFEHGIQKMVDWYQASTEAIGDGKLGEASLTGSKTSGLLK